MPFHIRLAAPGDEPGLARVIVDAWRVAYADILPIDELEAKGHHGLSYEKREEQWRRNLRGAFVAVEGDEILGLAIGCANRVPEVPCDGELEAIYVHPSAHRRGIGRALLRTVAEALLAQGYTSMSVWFFRDNYDAKTFYAAHGAEFFCSSDYEVGGVKYPDECYIWKSLADLVMALGSTNDRDDQGHRRQ